MYATTDRRVHLAACPNYDAGTVEQAVAECMNRFSLSAEIAGRRVLIKANLLGAYRPEKSVTTHPSVVAAVVRYAKAAGATSVMIADSPGGIFTRQTLEHLYQVTGMAKVAEETGAELNFVVSGEDKQGFFMADYIKQCDIILNLAKLKTHTFARLTAAVKNNYGTIPGLVKAKYHAKLPDRDRFARMLCNLCDIVKPSFSLIDGVVGMEGKGPAGGDPKHAGVLIAACNPHCADLVAAEVMQMDNKRIPTLVEAKKRGYVPDSIHEIELSGAPLSSVQTKFIPPPYVSQSPLLSLIPVPMRTAILKVLEPYPIITEKCIGCAKCAESCPKQTIEIVNRKAVIHYKNCIQCFCCQEMCAPKAIVLRRISPWAKRRKA